MTPEQIIAHSSKDLAAIFPDRAKADILKMRKRAHQCLWQRRYRQQGRASSHPYLGRLDGPAIERCPAQDALLEDAIIGSQKLLRALERAGVRP